MKVLVTGGGGFLGSSICRQLVEAGHQAVAFQRSAAPHLVSPDIEVRQGNLSDMPALLSALGDCDAVVHTAAKAGVWGDPEEYRSINVTGTANVIRACQKQGIRYLVHTSSPSVVHTGGDIEGGDESLPLATHFLASYPETKAEAERMVLKVNSERLRTVALRPHLIWGPDDPHILPRIAAKVRRGKLLLPGPEKIIDAVFIENAAQAHVQALENLLGSAECAGKPYFITNHEPLPQGEIIASLLAAIGVKVRIKAIPFPVAMALASIVESTWKFLKLKSEPPATRFAIEQLATAHWFDPAAAKRDFGYVPLISMREGFELLARQSSGKS